VTLISYGVILQIDSSAIVEMEVIDSDESDYDVDFNSEPAYSKDTASSGMLYAVFICVPSSLSLSVIYFALCKECGHITKIVDEQKIQKKKKNCYDKKLDETVEVF